MNRTQFDRLFDAAFEVSAEQLQDHANLDYRPSWNRVRQRLIAQRRRKGIRSKITKLVVIAASLLIGAAIFGNTQAARAIDPIYATLKEYPSGVMRFFFGRAEDVDHSKAKTTPPPEYLEGLNVERVNETMITAVVARSQVSNLLSFRAPEFRFVPTGYSFDTAQLYFYDGREKADQVIYGFKSDQDSYMTVVMRKVQPNTGFGMQNPTEGVTIEKIQLSDVPAILTTATNGSSALETISNGIHIAMNGIVPGDELIRVYEERYE